MIRRASIRMTFVAVCLLGCKPDGDEPQPPAPVAADDAARVFAEAVCGASFGCGCESAMAIHVDEATCIDDRRATYGQLIDEMLADGGIWNEDCAGQLVDAWSQWACLGPTMAGNAASYNPRLCPVIKGTRGLMDECSYYELGDDCSEGLSCVSGLCLDVEIPVPVGQLCDVEWDTLPCAAGSYCDWDDNYEYRICKALPAAGDPCDPNVTYLCGPASNDLFCSPESGTCEPAPGAGEPCFGEFLCAPGNYCDGGKDFTCQPRFELGDGCGADAVCPVDASCVANFCEADPPAVCSLVVNFL